MSKTKQKKAHVISIILWALATLSLFALTYEIYDANVLPSKYYGILGGVIVFLFIIFFLFISKKRTKNWVLVFFDLIFSIILAGCTFAVIEIGSLMNFLKDNLGSKYDTNVYYVLVNANSNYKTLSDIKGKTVKLVDDLNDKKTLKRNIDKKMEVNLEYVDDISQLLYDIEDDKELILFVNSGNYDAMSEGDELLLMEKKFTQETKILDTLEIQFKIANEETGLDVTQDPFVIYISGIDTRSGKLPAKSLSDVNIIMAVNPKTHKILMVHTPRDYFVQLHGTTGLKDKLTHAGVKGGYKLSMATLGDLYDMDVKYYIRVNFNSVIRLVDAIGGITVNSDVNYSFDCWGDRSCTIKPGDNKVDGKCALAFARERHAYITGDRHRGENQEQVIAKIIEKVTSSKTLISSYNNILKALEGTFQTNLSTDEITSLVKLQLDSMPSWTIETYNVTGSDASSYTYSYPNQKLYVMIPKEETVETAKKKIDEVLGTVTE